MKATFVLFKNHYSCLSNTGDDVYKFIIRKSGSRFNDYEVIFKTKNNFDRNKIATFAKKLAEEYFLRNLSMKPEEIASILESMAYNDNSKSSDSDMEKYLTYSNEDKRMSCNQATYVYEFEIR